MDAKEKYFEDHPAISSGITVFAVTGAIVAFIILLFWNAAITYLGWKWFIVPLGMPQIGLMYALGLGTFISWFSGPSYKGDKKDAMAWLLADIKRDAIVLAAMWVVHFFI